MRYKSITLPFARTEQDIFASSEVCSPCHPILLEKTLYHVMFPILRTIRGSLPGSSGAVSGQKDPKPFETPSVVGRGVQ